MLTLRSSLKTCCLLPPPEHMPAKWSPRVRLSSKTTWQEQASSSSDNLYNTVVVSARLRALSFTIPGPNSQSTLQTNFLELSLRRHHCLLVTQPLPGSCLSPRPLSSSSDAQPPERCPTLPPNFSGRRYLFSMAKSSSYHPISLPTLQRIHYSKDPLPGLSSQQLSLPCIQKLDPNSKSLEGQLSHRV